MPEPLSVAIITRDAARHLADCLASVAFADEVLVVDSGSRDATLEIARAYGARILHQDWLGFGRQKQFAVTQAQHDWVLCLDADERVSDELRASTQQELAAPRFCAYRMARRNRFMGRWLRHGEGYPDWSLRLFDRCCARWSDDPVHERVLADGPVGELKGDLLHLSENGLSDYIAKQDRYAALAAERLYASGRHASAARLVMSPLARFLRFYVLRLGFLDGVPGLTHILIGCFASFLKYAKLRELELTRSHDS
jgi:glycosyltransferase involved in cell wall biosynthesis